MWGLKIYWQSNCVTFQSNPNPKIAVNTVLTANLTSGHITNYGRRLICLINADCMRKRHCWHNWNWRDCWLLRCCLCSVEKYLICCWVCTCCVGKNSMTILDWSALAYSTNSLDAACSSFRTRLVTCVVLSTKPNRPWYVFSFQKVWITRVMISFGSSHHL